MKQLLQHDFCPSANRYVYWLKSPIGWVIIALFASVLLGLCVSKQAFLAAAAIASIGVIGCLWPWIAMLGVRGQLSWSQVRCTEGDAIETSLELTNRWPWPLWGLVIKADDAIASQVDTPDGLICLSRAPAMAISSFAWQCKPESRGVYPKKTIQLSTAFPFGIWTCRRTLNVPIKLTVWPKIVKLSDVPERSGANPSSVGSSSSQAGNEGDWMGVRPYRPGDSLRQVHWAQTARRDSLVVFERQSRSRQEVSIKLDPRSASVCCPAQREWLVRVLASVSSHFTKHHWGVRASVDGQWTSLYSNQASQLEWMDQLASWTPSDVDDEDLLAIGTPSDVKQVVVCVASRHQTLLSQYQGAASDVHWIVLDTNTCTRKDDFGATGSVLRIDDAGDHAAQLQQGWNRSCQRNYQLS